MTVSARLRRQAKRPRRRPGSGRRVPSSLRTTLPFERGERVLVTARGPGGDYAVIATDRALYHHDGGGWSRSGWERVAGVGWDPETENLVISALSSRPGEADSAIAPRRTLVPLSDRGAVPEVADERITHTRLGRWPVPLPDGQRVVAEARRRPVTGELSWIVIPEGTASANGPARAQLSAALARLSTELGFASQPTRPTSAPPLPYH